MNGTFNGPRPSYQPPSHGVEAAGLARRPKSRPTPPPLTVRLRRLTARLGGVRVLAALGLAVLSLDLAFRLFRVYERNSTLTGKDHFIVVMKVVLFAVAVYVAHRAVLHYRPIARDVRAVLVLALLPAATIAIFNLYGGDYLFGRNIALLQLVNLLIAVVGLLAYLMLYVWWLGRGAPPRDPARKHRKRRENLPPKVRARRSPASQANDIAQRRAEKAAARKDL